jgi:hypothetical protein
LAIIFTKYIPDRRFKDIFTFVVPVTSNFSANRVPEIFEILTNCGAKVAVGVPEYVRIALRVLCTYLEESLSDIVTGASLVGLIKLLVTDWAEMLAAATPVDVCK